MPIDSPDASIEAEQSRSLLQDQETSEQPSAPRRHHTPRQSSFSKRPSNGAPKTPRTPNRVRFDLEQTNGTGHELNAHAGTGSYGHIEEEEEDRSWYNDEQRASTGQLAPLLTGIEAPAVTIANELEFNEEELLEDARPKSGMASAFMNMANSIIGAGIIGQPYAFRQAGLAMGIFLLICLTITVDWTVSIFQGVSTPWQCYSLNPKHTSKGKYRIFKEFLAIRKEHAFTSYPRKTELT